MVKHEGNQSLDFGLLPAGSKFYSLETKTKVNSVIVQNIEVSYKQLFSTDIYKAAYQSLNSKPGNMTPGTDNETLDGVSIS